MGYSGGQEGCEEGCREHLSVLKIKFDVTPIKNKYSSDLSSFKNKIYFFYLKEKTNYWFLRRLGRCPFASDSRRFG